MRTTILFAWLLLAPTVAYAEKQTTVSPATHLEPVPQPALSAASQRIRRIVLNQGDDARALANLVQLSRNLPATEASQLYHDLAEDYLTGGKYNQAGGLLQQLLSQYPDQPVAGDALLRLIRIYSSGEVTHTEQTTRNSSDALQQRQQFAKYASYVATPVLQKNSALRNDAALTFQQAVATRLSGRVKAAQGRLTKLKHGRQPEPWRTRARVENWLYSDRKDASPIAQLVCRPTQTKPHLDGTLNDEIWKAAEPIQFAYDEQFLYLAITYQKNDDVTYTAAGAGRTFDTDLSPYDRVRLRLDIDRDYATSYDVTIDHRGWTNDRCWLDDSWNLQGYIAAGQTSTHWTVEAAVPWQQLASATPMAGEAWVFSTTRLSPDEEANEADFRLLLFE